VHKGVGAYVIPGEYVIYVGGETDAALGLAGLAQGLGAKLPLSESLPLAGVILFALYPY
jgi:hypothetical protein